MQTIKAEASSVRKCKHCDAGFCNGSSDDSCGYYVEPKEDLPSYDKDTGTFEESEPKDGDEE
jgi:hypothetical protein